MKIKLKKGEYTLNQVPFDYLKIGDKVTSLITGTKGEILKFNRYIHIDWINGNKSVQEHGVYDMVRYDEDYNGPVVLAPVD